MIVYRLECRTCHGGICQCEDAVARVGCDCDDYCECQGVVLPEVLEDCDTPCSDGFHEKPRGPVSEKEAKLWRWAFISKPPGAKGYRLLEVNVPAKHVIVGKVGKQCIYRASAVRGRKELKPGNWCRVISPRPYGQSCYCYGWLP